MTNAKQQPIILGAPDRERNPLRKLIAGFCDPFIPEDDEDQTVESHGDSPTNEIQRNLPVEATARAAPAAVNNSKKVQPRKGSSVRFEKLEIKGSLHIPAQTKATRTISEITIDFDSSMVPPVRDESKIPEIQIARKLVQQRRRHALQVFFASCLFVMAAIVTLHKLGYTSIADFHAPTRSLSSSSSSTRRPWIQIVDKTKTATTVESGTIKVKARTQTSESTKAATVDSNEKTAQESSSDPEATERKTNEPDPHEIKQDRPKDVTPEAAKSGDATDQEASASGRIEGHNTASQGGETQEL